MCDLYHLKCGPEVTWLLWTWALGSATGMSRLHEVYEVGNECEVARGMLVKCKCTKC